MQAGNDEARQPQCQDCVDMAVAVCVVQQENTELKRKISQLDEENAGLKKRISELDRENEKQAEQIFSLIEAREDLTGRLGALTMGNATEEEDGVEMDSPNYRPARPTQINTSSRRSSGCSSTPSLHSQISRTPSGMADLLENVPFTPEQEKKFKDVVTDNMEKFIEFTNFETLASHLRSARLLTDEEWHKLVSPESGLKHTKDKSRYFYADVINTKGMEAYTTFRSCLLKAQDHKGHEDLVGLLNQVIHTEETEPLGDTKL